MRKGRDQGQSRNRFHDDTTSGPDNRPRQPFRSLFRSDAEPAIEAIVKWFNPENGFGFVELADESGDTFLHITVLERGGHGTVLPETKLRVQVGQGQKGRQVTAVLELERSLDCSSEDARRKPHCGFGSREPGTKHLKRHHRVQPKI